MQCHYYIIADYLLLNIVHYKNYYVDNFESRLAIQVDP